MPTSVQFKCITAYTKKLIRLMLHESRAKTSRDNCRSLVEMTLEKFDRLVSNQEKL